MSLPDRTIPLAHPAQIFVDGQWVAPSTNDLFEVVDSASEQVAATVAEAHEADVDRAILAARTAFDSGPWPRLSPAERAQYLRAIAAEFEARADEFARIWSVESGILYKLSSARIGSWLAGAFNTYADIAETFAFEQRHRSSGGLEAQLVREPVGVVAAIVPWNGPAGLMAYKCAPALIAGCTLVLKMSPEAPCSGYIFAEICEKVGLPAGVVNVIATDRTASEALVADARIDKVTFTGSTGAGRKIAAVCAERIARVTLELGGKSPALILDDYDLATAAKVIAGGVGYLTGQVCHSLTRVIVPRARHDAMVDAMAETFASLKVGDPFDPATDVGPLSTDRHRNTVEHYIRVGEAEGARIAFGGKRPAHLNQGFYVEPTLFANVDNRSTIGQEEIFGPVIAVIPVDDEAQAIAVANDTIFGLNSSIFTNDLDRFKVISRQIRAGTVGHNASRTDFGIAFGGFKQSGLGREGGVEGLMPFLEAKTVVTDRPWQD